MASCCCYSVAKSCPTLCDPMDCSIPHFSVLHHLLEFAQTHVYWFNDAIQQSHPLSPLLLPSIFSSIRAFSKELALHIRWPKYCPLSCFADTETLTRWKKLTVCCSQAHIPQTSWNQKVMMLTSSDLTTNQLEDCPHVDHTLLLECYDSLLPLPGRVGHTILRAVSCCGLFCLAKQES